MQQLSRNDSSVTRHGKRSKFQCPELLKQARVATQAARFEHGNPGCQRLFADWRRTKLHPSSSRLVRLCNSYHRLETTGKQLGQHMTTEWRATEERKTQ
jgi:hypothetical protein